MTDYGPPEPSTEIICTICGMPAIASWNMFGKKIATCWEHRHILTNIQKGETMQKYYKFYNGVSPWNPFGYWYMSSGIVKK